MKRTFQFLALVAICCAMMASCKNNKTTEPTPEEIQAQKAALADSVLAQIDAFADEYMLASDNDFRFVNFELTEEEKMVKPDYLLDPSIAVTLVTKSQKVNALGIYLVDMLVRKAYDMPLEETEEVMAKLAVEINHPVDVNISSDFEMPASEKIRKEYEACKERGDLAYFWQFQDAIMWEAGYILANNPELFYNKITDAQWQAYYAKTEAIHKAIEELAKYDEEIAQILETKKRAKVFSSPAEVETKYKTREAAKQFHIDKKDICIARRNALLQ